MRRHWGLVIAIGGLLALAGCIGDVIDDPASPQAPNATGEPASEPSNTTEPTASDADGPGSTSQANGSSGPQGSEDADATGPRPLGDLTMEGAHRARPNATTVVFTWNTTVPRDAATVQTPLEVPGGIPFEADVHLAWEGTDPLGVRLTSGNTSYLCRDVATIAGTGDEACSTTSLARTGGTWSAQVVRGVYDNVNPAVPDRGRAVPVTVTVELRSLALDAVPEVPALVEAPSPFGERVDPGWSQPDEAPIRPGIKIDSGACTANFIFQSPDNATLYIGTASHCVVGETLGAEIGIGYHTFDGTLVYCSWGAKEQVTRCPQKTWFEDPGYEDDLALVKIPAKLRDKVHPATLVWGGPTDLDTMPQAGGTLLAYGNAEYRDVLASVNTLDARPGVVLERGEASTLATFANPVIPGDSGGLVLAQDGAATGVLSYLDLGGDRPTGQAGIAHLDHALEQLETHTGRTVELATWPMFDPPRGEIRETGSPLPEPPADAAQPSTG